MDSDANAPDSRDSLDDPGPGDTSEGASDLTEKLHSLNVNAKPFVPNVNAPVFVPLFLKTQAADAPDSRDSLDDPGPRDTSEGASDLTEKLHSLNVNAKPFVPNVNAPVFVPPFAANVAPSTNGDAKPEISEQYQQVQEGVNLREGLDPAQRQWSSGKSFQEDMDESVSVPRAVDGPLRVPLPERYEVKSFKSNMPDSDKGECGIISGYTKIIQSKNDEIHQLKRENAALKAANHKAEEHIRDLLRAIAVLQDSLSERGVHSARKSDHSAQELEYVNSLICLGQMCSEIQTFMYRYVHPSLFREKETYLFHTIENDIKKIGDLTLKREAKDRLAGLKRTLKWNDRIHTPKVISLYTERNKTFHTLLCEEKLRESLAVWRRLGMLNDDEETIQGLIEMWLIMRNWQS